jgi:hypothetical protein
MVNKQFTDGQNPISLPIHKLLKFRDLKIIHQLNLEASADCPQIRKNDRQIL